MQPLLLPFLIKQLHNSAALAPHQPRLLELKEELDRAYRSGDKIGVQRVAPSSAAFTRSPA
jgi:YidC/Oxa1 family membrane protein insertase